MNNARMTMLGFTWRANYSTGAVKAVRSGTLITRTNGSAYSPLSLPLMRGCDARTDRHRSHRKAHRPAIALNTRVRRWSRESVEEVAARL